MKVKMLKTGEQKEVNNSYGTRLIEQGQAVAVPEAKEEPTGTAGKRAMPIPAFRRCWMRWQREG